MKDTLKYLSEYPSIGITSSLGTSFLHFFEVVNPILSFIAMTIGIITGIITLSLKFKEWIK